MLMLRAITASRSCAMLIILTQSGFAASITLQGTIRDFLYAGTPLGTYNGFAGQGHPDFQNALGDDRGIVLDTIGNDGKPVYASPTTTPTTHGHEFFDMWFRDTPGYNTSMSHSVTADETSPGSGMYRYDALSFFPIDNELYRNQGDSHNYAFTYELPSTFTYRPGQNFMFTGDDDVWVFINRRLVIDLGGVDAAESASVDLDTLGLVEGHRYDFHLFFAERHTVESNLRFETSIELRTDSPVPEPSSLLLAAGGLGLFATAMHRSGRNRAPQNY